MARKVSRVVALTLSLALLGGVVTPGAPAGASPPDPPPAPGKEPTPEGALTLADALSLALSRNPALAAAAFEIRAAQGRALQAGLLPNPELSLEAENLFGPGELRGFDAAETTLSLSQVLEPAGKRPKRAKVASLESDLAKWDYEARKADVLAETAKSFIDVLEAGERAALAEELRRLAEQVLETVSQRVDAGKVPPLEETRAGIALANSRIEVERARRALEAARKRLAVAWGGATAAFDRAVGTLENVQPVPPVEELAEGILRNPDLARWDTELARRRADLAFQEAGRFPDLTLGGGIRDFRETGDRAFVLGGSVPIPLFDRNQGEILAARHRLAKAERDRAAAEARVRADLAQAYGALSASAAEVEALKTAVLPAARSVFDAAGEGYRQGKFGLLEVLDAQRILFDARGRYLSALAAYGNASVDVGRAIGRLPGIPGEMPEQE